MAEMKIDIAKVVARSAEIVLDETTYCGKTIREWIADITNETPSDVHERKRLAWDWNGTTGCWLCPNCRKEFEPDEINGVVWEFCPMCGTKLEAGGLWK